jgi:transposase
VAERDASLVGLDKPAVGDGNAVRVARKVGQNLLRSGERRLGIDVPVGVIERLETLFADSAYQGPFFANALIKILPDLETEIVRRSDRATGFVRLPKRWIVERTIAWLKRCRRLAKDWENLNRNALAFLKLAAIRLMLRKLCNA